MGGFLPPWLSLVSVVVIASTVSTAWGDTQQGEGAEFFERRIRPLLIQHCYECHSEKSGEQQGELLLDRRSGWVNGGTSGKAVVPGDADASLLIRAVRYQNDELEMPPDGKLSNESIQLLEQWVRMGAPGPRTDLGETEFSRLGDQTYLFGKSSDHWAFQPVQAAAPPTNSTRGWNRRPIDQWVIADQSRHGLTPSPMAASRTLARRLYYDLTGLPPSAHEVNQFAADIEANRDEAIDATVDRLLGSPAFGEHFARMWLDVARYADTDSAYRPDTKTPHYFPFAFTYRNYVIESFNADKPFDEFVREQLAADLLDLPDNDPRLAALGFLTVGPHANRSPAEAIDDWIDVTTRGLMGLTVACARCHDHKFEPIPTADYYSLHGVFSSVTRINPLDEKRQPQIDGYTTDKGELADYQRKRNAIAAKIEKAGKSKAKGNNRSVAQKIRETELAELLLHHPGAPVHTMAVAERKPVTPYIMVRGLPGNRGETVPRRFLKVLDPEQPAFAATNSGRLDLANKIVSPNNPLTARVLVNRVWGSLIGSYLVETPSDFGLQAAEPTHPELLDWLASDFVTNGWSIKHLVRTIVTSRTYQQRSAHREDGASVDPQNLRLWRANRKRLSIEEIRDSILTVADALEGGHRFRAQPLWGPDYTRRRAVYGYVNRFNLDPTLRSFDFPTPMQTQPQRGESIVAPQALFTMNSPFIIDQAVAITEADAFQTCKSDADRVKHLVLTILQREPHANEVTRVTRFVESQERFFPDPKRKPKTPPKVTSPWALVAQSLMMSNEFQYID